MKVLIYGGGHLGIQAYHLIRGGLRERLEVAGFIDDFATPGKVVVGDAKVLGGHSYLVENTGLAASHALVMAIGPNALQARAERFRQLRDLGFSFPNLVHKDASVDPTTVLGDGNLVLAGAVLDHSVRVGSLNYIDLNVALSHNTEIGDNNFITVGTCTAGFVKIGNNCFIGMHTTITDKVTIGDGCFIYAKGLVSHAVDAGSRVITVYDRKTLPTVAT